ncbi:hypothetical protein M9435_000316 [Picochlorum sp. BPE23]|nr:hypothetical protein M9435_000316 [Picochlorum sp. BPE23]
MQFLLILTILHLCSWAQAGVFPSCQESRLRLMTPSYEVLQVIDDSLHLWEEYEMGNNSVCIRLERPYQKVLDKEEAENLLARSARWEEEEYDFPSVSPEEQEQLMAKMAQDVPLDPVWDGGIAVLLENDDSPDQGISESDIVPNVTMFGNSTGSGSSRTVFPPDDRVEVSNTQNFPFNVVSFMSFKSGTDDYRCTAFIVAPHMALTSGHCVFNGETGFSEDAKIFPGQTENKIFQQLSSCRISTNTKNTECMEAGNSVCPEYDYGALFFSPQMAPSAKTYMPLVIDNPAAGTTLNTAGYPADVGGKIRRGQWRASGEVSITPDDSRVLYHRVDTTGGQSGSPIYLYTSSSNYRRVIAIQSASSTQYNIATRISDANKSLLIEWLEDTDPCN